MVPLACLLVLASGCGLLRAPQKVVSAVVPPVGRSAQPDPVNLQLQLERYVDDFTTRTSQALDDYAQRVGTESARVRALRLKVVGGSSMISIVSGPNPSANLLDVVSVTVLTRMTIEDYWIKTANGAAFQPWLDVCHILETNVWQLAAHFLPLAQVDELRLGIRIWYEQNPDARTAFFARPIEFASMLRESKGKNAELSSVFSLVSLDPTAGLDPAVREVTRTRLFAERALYTMQRMPFLLRLQTELLGYELAAQPAVQLALTNTARLSDSADRLSRAAESISQTAARLPDQVAAERKQILAALDQQEGKLRDLAAQVDNALESGDRMSGSLNTTIKTFDGLMKRFGVGEPATNAAPPDTNSPPFSILDYASTATQISDMAKQLNTLIESVNQSVPQLEHLSQQAGIEVQKAVDHGFRLGLVLVVVLLTGAVLVGLVFWFLRRKLSQPTP